MYRSTFIARDVLLLKALYMLNMIQLRTGRLSRTWLIENYARVIKENGCGAVNTNNTMGNTLKNLQAQYIAHILLNGTFLSGNH